MRCKSAAVVHDFHYFFYSSHLEDDTERIRREVVQRKRGLDVSQLNRLNGDLESLGKHLAELKS